MHNRFQFFSYACIEGICVISWEKNSTKSISSSHMSLWPPPCSLIPSTSLHLPTLLLCTLSNVTLFDTQGWRPGRRADRDLAYWDVCFIIDCLIQNLSSDENTPDSPGSFLEACCQFIPIYTVVHWSLRLVEHIVWVFTFIERRFKQYQSIKTTLKVAIKTKMCVF